MASDDIFSEESLLATIDVDLVRSMGSGLPAHLRFFQGVVEGIRNYVFGLVDVDSFVPFCVFLSEPPEFDGRHPQRRFFFRQGQESFTGKTWFVSADVGSAHFIERVASSLGDEVAGFTAIDPELGTAPLILVHRTAEDFTITFMPSGIDDGGSKIYKLKDIHEPTTDEVRAKIELAYEEALRVVPSAHSSVRIWRSGTPKRPLEFPERTIQGYLRMALITAFPGCTAKEEQDTAAGRFDLALVSQRGNTVAYHGLLELKVLQARVSGQKAVKKGLSQAIGYRNQLGATWSRLVSFDMSQPLLGESVYDEIRDAAASEVVELDYWPLYPTPDDFRNANY